MSNNHEQAESRSFASVWSRATHDVRDDNTIYNSSFLGDTDGSKEDLDDGPCVGFTDDDNDTLGALSIMFDDNYDNMDDNFNLNEITNAAAAAAAAADTALLLVDYDGDDEKTRNAPSLANTDGDSANFDIKTVDITGETDLCASSEVSDGQRRKQSPKSDPPDMARSRSAGSSRQHQEQLHSRETRGSMYRMSWADMPGSAQFLVAVLLSIIIGFVVFLGVYTIKPIVQLIDGSGSTGGNAALMTTGSTLLSVSDSMPPTPQPSSWEPSSSFPTANPTRNPSLRPTLMPFVTNTNMNVAPTSYNHTIGTMPTPTTNDTSTILAASNNTETSSTIAKEEKETPTPSPSIGSSSPTLSPVRDFDPSVVAFYAMGDIPQEESEMEILRKNMQELPSPDIDQHARFVIHLGDIQDPDETDCKESHYAEVREALQMSPYPVVVVPGDNEFQDCPNQAEARLYWDKHLLDLDMGGVSGNDTDTEKARASSRGWEQFGLDLTRSDKRRENWAFYLEGNNVLFIGLNMLGGNPNDKEEWNERLGDDWEWTIDNINDHRDEMVALVVFGHSYPKERNVPYFEPFAREVKSLGIPVLYMHGEGEDFELHEGAMGVSNLLGAQVDRGGSSPPVRVTVRVGDVIPFRFNHRD